MMVFYTRFLSDTKRYLHNAALAFFVWMLSFLCLYIVMCVMFITPIALHEFGHYGACKSLGIGVLPLGGFNMPIAADSFTGEHPSFRLAEDASAAEKLWISSAGILANLLTCFLIYAFFYYRDIRYSKESNSAVFEKHYKSFCRVFCYVCLSIFSFGFLPKNKALIEHFCLSLELYRRVLCSQCILLYLICFQLLF